MALRKTGRLWFVALFALSFGVGYAQRASAWWPGGPYEECVDEDGNTHDETDGCDGGQTVIKRPRCSCLDTDSSSIIEQQGYGATISAAELACERNLTKSCRAATQECFVPQDCCATMGASAEETDGVWVVTCIGAPMVVTPYQ